MAAKKVLEAQTASDERLCTPSEIGIALAEAQGSEKPVSAVKVNQMLEEAGLQYKKPRTSNKTGKQKWDWALSDIGKEYGQYVFTIIQNSTGNKQPVKWHLSKTLEFLLSAP